MADPPWHADPDVRDGLVQDIDVLCTECSNLIDNHEKIQVLSAVHYNLGKTLQNVENIVNLPQEAADAERMLQDDTQLLQVVPHNMPLLPLTPCCIAGGKSECQSLGIQIASLKTLLGH